MGESIMEATILHWLKKPGDRIEEGESIVEIATDKVDSEVPSPYHGVLKKIIAKKGEVIAIGTPIARMEILHQTTTSTTTTSSSSSKSKNTPYIAPKAKTQEVPSPSSEKSDDSLPTHSEKTGRVYTPLVRYMARTEAISQRGVREYSRNWPEC